jgi:hypothetical protein
MTPDRAEIDRGCGDNKRPAKAFSRAKNKREDLVLPFAAFASGNERQVTSERSPALSRPFASRIRRQNLCERRRGANLNHSLSLTARQALWSPRQIGLARAATMSRLRPRRAPLRDGKEAKSPALFGNDVQPFYLKLNRSV